MSSSSNKKYIKLDLASTIQDGTTSLFSAVETGNLELTRQLLQNSTGANSNELNDDGENLLHVAARIGAAALIDLLLTAGLDVNVHTTIDNLTPLHLAVRHNHLDVVRLLLDNGAQVNAQDLSGNTPLHKAIRHDRVDAARLLLRHVDVLPKNTVGENALHFALRLNQSAALLEILVEMCPRNVINEPNYSGFYPLYLAILNAKTRDSSGVVRALLKRGADVAAADRASRILSNAIQTENREIIEHLLDHGARVDLMDNEHRMPLLMAIRSFEDRDERYQMCLSLLNRGALVNPPLYFGGRRFLHGTDVFLQPLYAAIEERRDERLAQLLIERGARIRTRTIYQLSTLARAVKHSFVDLAKQLLEMEARGRGSFISRSVIMIAVAAGNEKMISLLVRYGDNYEDVAAGRSIGASMLAYAISCKKQAVVRYLCENDVDVNSEVYGKLPLFNAIHGFYNMRCDDSKSIMFLVLKYIALLVAQGKHVREQNMKLIEECVIMSDEYESCHRELEDMKSTKVSDFFSVTYFNLLTNRDNAVEPYLRSESVRSTLLSGKYRIRYPKYSEQMQRNCSEEMERWRVKDKFQRLLCDVFAFVLPHDIMLMIGKYYCYEDLKSYFENQS